MLTKAVVRDYHPTFCKEALLLASSILENPKALEKHIERGAASATMTILYDYPTLENEHDRNLMEIHAFIDRMSAASVPGAHLVELIPWMIHIPERYTFMLSSVCLNRLSRWNSRFAKWKREGLEHFRQHTAMFSGLLNTVYHDLVSEAAFAQRTFLRTRYLRQKDLRDRAWVHR